ncbi:MAG TPA: antibiotic biosynthesis monooxygenase [Gaiellaceae bacterium]|jgi:heme-degrading monooxygenase HmoA|nr:antibiotic biosynthesis monooxygenase [Gaiellaceae bacterium]
MVARATLAEIDPVRQSPHEAIAVFEEAVVPALREQDGYEGSYVLLSEEGKVLVLTFWQSDEKAQASRASGFYQAQIEKLSDFVFFRSSPGREGYEVVVADAPVAAAG